MHLGSFGFTGTQDVVFKALLARDTATGYVIARDTNLARANVYQALDALVARGIASRSEGRPARYRALSAREAVAHLRRGVEAALADLADELGVPAVPPRAHRPVSAILTRRSLAEAATAAVDAAEREVLAVVGPWAAEVLAALHRARGRGVSSRVVSLGTPAPEGALVRTVPEPELTAYWGGLPLVLVCDRAHAVCGVVSGERADGLDTRSPGVVPFLRHLLRREIASTAAPRPS